MCYPRGGTFLIYSTHEENPCNLCEANSFHSFVIYAHPSNHYFCTKFFEVVFLNWCFKCFGCFRCFRCFRCFWCFRCFRCFRCFEITGRKSGGVAGIILTSNF